MVEWQSEEERRKGEGTTTLTWDGSTEGGKYGQMKGLRKGNKGSEGTKGQEVKTDAWRDTEIEIERDGGTEGQGEGKQTRRRELGRTEAR